MARKIGSRYVALKVLGRGASGTVWQGEGPEGPVAIKLLREDLASDQVLVARFVQERTALTSLDHPNIVGVHDLVVDGTDLALVMDLVIGPDLRARLERERVLTPRLAAAIVADVADGLSAAHAEGVIHRDVKPENILIDNSAGVSRARLTDFGIARLVDAPRRTRATRIIGTPDYLAPEIIEGLQPTAAVDVYALATVLYELLTGWTPFGGGHPGAVLRRHVTEPVPGIPGLPDPLAAVLASCLSKAPAARLTAREFGERLRSALPALIGLPAFDVPDPNGNVGRQDTPVPRPAGVVPLVSGTSEAADGSRDTHTNLTRPVFDGAAPVQSHRRGKPARREGGARRRLIPVICGVLAVAAVGAGAVWFTRDEGSPTRPAGQTSRTPQPTPPGAAGGPAGPTAGRTTGGYTWAAFAPLPAAPVLLQGGPAVTRTDAEHSYVVQRDGEGALWYLGSDGSRWGEWRRLPTFRTADDPAVVSAAPGRVDVFAVGSADKLLYRATLADGRFGEWTRTDAKTKLSGAPAAVATGDRIDIVARTGTDGLAAGSLTGSGWSGFTTVPSAGRIEAAPALTAGAPGALDAFVVRAGDHAVLHIPFVDGGWREPERVGLTASARPAAAYSQGRGLVVLARDGNGRLLGAVPGEGGWRPVDPNTATADAPAAVAAGVDRVDVYIRTDNGRLQASSSSPDAG
ncbi:protein kinase [Embleya sp. NPDC005575]|uniref:protein kinase domain-containing protein n=1 Tax=Embleya sp. NPDC005575 TaxID=3156892 RepID=UPI0033BEA1C4